MPYRMPAVASRRTGKLPLLLELRAQLADLILVNGLQVGQIRRQCAMLLH